MTPASPDDVEHRATIIEASSCEELDHTAFPESGEKIAYRCRLIEQLKSRGVDFPSPIATRILGEIARPYATSLKLKGEVPLSRAVLDFLFYELPDTARLVNHFEATRYLVNYTRQDRSQFFATNNRNMRATFDYLDPRKTKTNSNYLLFESGKAKLLFWNFRGNTLIELNFVEVDEGTRYEAIIHIFTESRSFRSFFESGLFRYLMGSMFRRILGSIVSAAQQLANSNAYPDFVNPSFADELIKRLQ